MDPLFDRMELFQSQGLLTEDELEMVKASIVELALTEGIDLTNEPDFVATDGRSLVEHAREACNDAEIDLGDEDDGSNFDDEGVVVDD